MSNQDLFKYLNKGISTPIGILVIVLVILITGGGILVWQYFGVSEEQSIMSKKTTSNIIQEQDFKDLIIEEDNGYTIYKGIIYDQLFYINDSEISFSLDFNYDSCTFYSVKGNINDIFLDEESKLRKLSLSEINELKQEEVLSVTVIVKKETAFMKNLKNFFKPVVFASCYYTIGEISNPEKIIFKKPEKQELIITGKTEGSVSGYLWSFEPDENQGLRIRNYVGTDGKEHYKIEVTYPSFYFIKFKNNSDYFKTPVNNFVQNFFSIEKITIQGEENCPDFNMPCLIKAETVKVETSLLLQDDKIFKPLVNSGTINYVFCPDGPSERCYFWLEDSLSTYITNSTKFINGKIQNIKKGQSVKAEGRIECPNLSDILSEKNNVDKNFVSCKFFADKIEFTGDK